MYLIELGGGFKHISTHRRLGQMSASWCNWLTWGLWFVAGSTTWTIYHTSMPKSKHDAKTFKILGWSGESRVHFDLFGLTIQWKKIRVSYERCTDCWDEKFSLRDKLAKLRQQNQLVNPLLFQISNLKDTKISLETFFQGHAAGSREFLLLSFLFILIYFVFYFIGNSILKDGQENEFQSAVNERKELSSKICLTIKLSTEKKGQKPWLFKGIFQGWTPAQFFRPVIIS